MPTSSWRRGALLLALGSVPLMAPAGANAAMGGALTLNSTVTPDLISATVTNVSPNGTTVNYCFNKPLGSTPIPGLFVLRTYRPFISSSTANSATTNGQCASAVFNGVLDPSTWTAASIRAGAVVNGAVGAPTGNNNADSTALILPVGMSGTNNGTRGRSAAPDLIGATASGNKVTYVWDEALDHEPTPAEAANFELIDVNGVSIGTGTSAALSSDRKSVTITFSVPVPQVVAAVRAAYNGVAGVTSLATPNDAFPSSVAMPNGTGATTIPDPIQGILISNGTTNEMDVVFDQPVTAGAVGDYDAVRSTGFLTAPISAVNVNANTVRLTFVNLNTHGEFIVGVVVGPAAVVGGNTYATVPAGANAGAFAAGFTTGPEAVRATFDGPTNTATITFDQRYGSADATLFRRVDNTGTVNNLDTATLSFTDTAVPKQTPIEARFASLAGTRGIQILEGAVTTPSPVGGDNVDQILAPSSSNAG